MMIVVLVVAVAITMRSMRIKIVVAAVAVAMTPRCSFLTSMVGMSLLVFSVQGRGRRESAE